MARRAENSGITLSVGDVAIIKGMLRVATASMTSPLGSA